MASGCFFVREGKRCFSEPVLVPFAYCCDLFHLPELLYVTVTAEESAQLQAQKSCSKIWQENPQRMGQDQSTCGIGTCCADRRVNEAKGLEKAGWQAPESLVVHLSPLRGLHTVQHEAGSARRQALETEGVVERPSPRGFNTAQQERVKDSQALGFQLREFHDFPRPPVRSRASKNSSDEI